jgi:hypothetical protein
MRNAMEKPACQIVKGVFGPISRHLPRAAMEVRVPWAERMKISKALPASECHRKSMKSPIAVSPGAGY